MRTIVVASCRGGTGKTTIALNLASTLSHSGSTLLIDFDRKSDCALGLAVPHSAVRVGAIEFFCQPRVRRSPRWDRVVWPMTSRFDFLPARPGGGLVDLRGNDLQVAGTIEDRLESFGKQYDFVVIDAPVGDDVLLRMALSSASDLLIPITPGFFSISSVESEMKIHHCVDRKCLNSIRTSLILNMYDHRNRFSREMQKRLRANWPDIVLDSFIRHSIKIPEAASFGQPLSVYDARTAANEDFSALASEMQSLGTRSIRRAMMENENFNHLRLVELPSSRIAKFPRIPSGVDDRADGRFAEKDKARSAFVGVVDQES